MWTLLIIAVCSLAPESGAGPHSVALDMRALDRDTFARLEATGLYKSLLVRLVSERFAVVDATETADIVVRFERPNGTSIAITASTSFSVRQTIISLADLESEQARIGIIHATLGLIADIEADLLKPVQVPAVLPIPESSPALPIVAHAAALALLSGGKVGILLAAAASAKWKLWQPTLGMLLHEPLMLPQTLSVTEWGAYAGVGSSGSVLAPWLTLDGVLALGIWQQRFSYADSAGNTGQGSSLDPMLLGRVGLCAILNPRWSVGAYVGGLATLHEHQYRTVTTVLWRAPQLRPFGGFGLTLSM